MNPSVLVDATAIPRNRGGVGRYLEHLLPALDAGGARLTIVAQAHDAAWLSSAAPHAQVVVPKAKIASRPRRLLWEQFGLPRLAARHHADVIFSPHYTMPILSKRPIVVTVHDATFFSHPELHGRSKGVFFRAWTRYSLRHAAALVVPSVATESELARWVPGSRGPLTVAYHGVNSDTFHAPSAQELRGARDLVGSDHWIAFLGTIEPRKNVASLVAAFGIVARDDRVAERFPGLVLALAGGSGWDTQVDGAIAGSPVNDRILRLGFVPDDLLSGLLGGSLAVVYPSLGEGFGLPVLEAMASGSAVVTSPILALPEVGGEVAVYAATDVESIARALTALLLDDADRARRGAEGQLRAAEFSWEASAQSHAAVFQDAAAHSSPGVVR